MSMGVDWLGCYGNTVDYCTVKRTVAVVSLAGVGRVRVLVGEGPGWSSGPGARLMKKDLRAPRAPRGAAGRGRVAASASTERSPL